MHILSSVHHKVIFSSDDVLQKHSQLELKMDVIGKLNGDMEGNSGPCVALERGRSA